MVIVHKKKTKNNNNRKKLRKSGISWKMNENKAKKISIE